MVPSARGQPPSCEAGALPSLTASLPPRSVTKLLEDLVYFVTGGTNSGQDVLEVVFSKPNRERQKLMREQNILKQVGETGHLRAL